MTGVRSNSQPGEAHGADDSVRASRVARSAWLLAALAVAFYVVYVGWFLWRSVAGH